jgi:hypothetical protein
LVGSRNAIKSVAEEGNEQVHSIRDYEVGHLLLSDGFPTS